MECNNEMPITPRAASTYDERDRDVNCTLEDISILYVYHVPRV